MLFAQDNDVVDALASDRPDQSFGEAVLPRRARGDGLVTDAHGSESVPDGSAVDLIPIADQVARGLIPRECLRDLTCDPVCGRMRSDVDPDEVSWLFKIQALREIPRRALASQRIPPVPTANSKRLTATANRLILAADERPL
jgi:hypothetical protein